MTAALVLAALLAVACVVIVALPFLLEPAPTADRVDDLYRTPRAWARRVNAGERQSVSGTHTSTVPRRTP